MSEVGPQPLDPVLTLLRRAQVTLAGQGLRDLDEDVFVFGAALQVLLDVLAPPDVQEDLRLPVGPDKLRAVSRPLGTCTFKYYCSILGLFSLLEHICLSILFHLSSVPVIPPARP